MTIGFLVDWTVSPYHHPIFQGVCDQAEKKNINLICFENEITINAENAKIDPHITANLLSECRIDGLIILAGSINTKENYNQHEAPFARIASIPVVSIAFEVGNSHSILVNNRAGIESLMVHLLEDHHFKKFAFIRGTRGNFDADERFEAFIKVLNDYKITMNENLIFNGDFRLNSGIEAVRYFYNNRDPQIDAIISSNDAMAISATRELARKGIKVPEDVSVVGFDNLIFSRYSIPPLTTVSQPLYQQGTMAVESLYDLIKGKHVPQKILMDPELVIRESCSCFTNRSTALKDLDQNHQKDFGQLFNSKKEYLLSRIFNTVTDLFKNHVIPDLPSLIDNLLDEFSNSVLKRSDTIFLKSFIELVASPALKGGEIFSLHSFISEIRYNVFPFIHDRETLSFAEDLCNKATDMIGYKALQVENFDHNELIVQNQILSTLHEELIPAKGLDALFTTLRKRLPEMEIKSCYISLFCGKGDNFYKDAKLAFIHSKENKSLKPNEEIIYPTTEIIPKQYFPARQRLAIIIKHLKRVGFIILELKKNDDMKIYTPLCELLANALSSTLYFTEVQNQKEILNQNLARLRKAMSGFIETMALTIETRDPYTAGHQRRVSDLARQIATRMGLPEAEIESIRMAGIVHDLGKIYVPSEILNKPGELQDIELNLIRTHPKIAYDILKNIDFPWPIAEIIYQHHEKLDGSGYPRGLKGKMIRIEARILTVADVVEAMASHRPYRPALGIDRACEEINHCKGKLYDPAVVDCCIKLFKEEGYKFK